MMKRMSLLFLLDNAHGVESSIPAEHYRFRINSCDLAHLGEQHRAIESGTDIVLQGLTGTACLESDQVEGQLHTRNAIGDPAAQCERTIDRSLMLIHGCLHGQFRRFRECEIQ